MKIVNQWNATNRITDPDFLNSKKSKIPSKVQQQIISYYNHGKGNMFTKNASETRVYYAEQFFQSKNKSVTNSLIEKMLTAIPQVCVSADKYIQLQDGRVVDSYKKALSYYPNLLTYDERILSRRKIIISPTQLFSYGGYNSDVKIITTNKNQTIIVLSCAGAQLDVPQLDFKLYIDTKKRYFEKLIDVEINN
jgi:hypothetical protein